MDTLKKEQIKDRLVRMAARHWDMNENEIDANFDPLVSLLFDALSAELEGVGYQIKEIQSDLMNEFASIMMPLTMLQNQPAHCIAASYPVDDVAMLTPSQSFQTIVKIKKGNAVDQEDASLHFIPIGDVKLFKTSVQFIKVGGRLYECNGNKSNLLFENVSGGMHQVIHFALAGNSHFKNLSGLQFFFDLKGHSEADNFYNAMQEADLIINNVPTHWQNGYYKNKQYSTGLEDVMNDFNYSAKVKKAIAAIYRPQFMTVEGESLQPADSSDSAGFWNDAPEDIRKNVENQPLIYGSIQLKRPFPTEVFERLVMSVNAFPLLNQKEMSVSLKTNKWVNIIPLPVKNCFLSLNGITSVEGIPFKYRLGQSVDGLEAGEAILRTSQVGKTGSKDMRKTIQNLLDSIRDQSAYFSHVNNDFITARLQEISKILTRLDDRLTLSADVRPKHYYILLKPHHVGSDVEVKYAVTDGGNAMQLKAGAVLSPFKHTLTGIAATVALTNTIGAIEHMNQFASQQYLLRQLSSKGKIISVEDIRRLCFQIVGESVTDVKINRMMKVMQPLHQGLERVVEIKISLQNPLFSSEEIYYFKQRILHELEKDAAFVYPFEVIFENRND